MLYPCVWFYLSIGYPPSQIYVVIHVQCGVLCRSARVHEKGCSASSDIKDGNEVVSTSFVSIECHAERQEDNEVLLVWGCLTA